MNQEITFEPLRWEERPVEDAFQELIDQVARMSASDLYLSSLENHVEIAVRRMGMVHALARVPRAYGRRLMNHVKVLAQISIDETRRPQEGRIVTSTSRGKMDLRVNTLATLFGEDFSIRLLLRDAELRRFENLGLLPKQLAALIGMLNSPGGLILVTGPTSSGKTTTLYACLEHLNNGKRKINTIEDPVEYALEGIRQSQVNYKINVDFPELLRSVLRQAPDVIMVGEIRDPITAQTAVRAANSGHLVLATLHAPVAGAAVHSMLAYDVNPYFLANSLRGVVAQRLIRTLCPACREAIDLSEAPETFRDIRDLLPEHIRPALYSARGCQACNFEEYAGRTGLFEVMVITKQVRAAVAAGMMAREIERVAIEDGMLEFYRAGMIRVATGDTSIEEMMRAVPAEFLGADV